MNKGMNKELNNELNTELNTGFNTRVWLYGKLAKGSRARVLNMTTGAELADGFPDESGILCLSGDDFLTAECEQALLSWIQEAGRMALITPPFTAGNYEGAFHWSVQFENYREKTGFRGLSGFLADEIQYRLSGDFLTEQIGSLQAENGSLMVGYYRPRLVTGILAFTVLPIWSLRTLDKPELLQKWLERLYEQAGQKQSRPVATKRALQPLHFSLLLHLASGVFESQAAACAALENSTVFNITPQKGQALCHELLEMGLVAGAELTADGQKVLAESPYAVYLSALKEGK